MVIDTFTFFNELDLLEIRLHTLDKYVDKFVIVEGDRTHTNNPKSLNFELNKDRFAPFLHKIHYFVVDTWPGNTSSWSFEHHQRNCITTALDELNLSDDDIVLFSDVDEIPNPELFVAFDYLDQFPCVIFNQRLFYCYFNMECLDTIHNSGSPWVFMNTRAMKYGVAKNLSSDDARRFNDGALLTNAGWHFSFLSTFENVVYKLKSFAHTEFANDFHFDPEVLKARIISGYDLLHREFKFGQVELDQTFPKYLIANKSKFKEFLL